MNGMSENGLVLVTGATGYIGGRLVPRLLTAGYRVRCLVRDPGRLQGRSWLKQVEVVKADALEPGSLEAALKGVDAAYYLIHGLKGGTVNAERDLQAARNFIAGIREPGSAAHHLPGRARGPDRTAFAVPALTA